MWRLGCSPSSASRVLEQCDSRVRAGRAKLQIFDGVPGSGNVELLLVGEWTRDGGGEASFAQGLYSCIPPPKRGRNAPDNILFHRNLRSC